MKNKLLWAGVGLIAGLFVMYIVFKPKPIAGTVGQKITVSQGQ
jgi:hypothetical protein